MPIYNVQAPDGKVYKVEGPENADPELLFATVAQKNQFASLTTEQLKATPSASTSIGDIGRSLGTGLVGGVKSIADVFGAGSDVSEYLGETMQGLQAGLTPERQAEMARRAELISRADKSGSLMEQAKAYLGGVTEAPLQTTVQALGTSVPTIVAGLATLPASAPAGIAAGVGIISRLAIGAAQGVGEFKGSAYDSVKDHYLKEGKSPPEAARLAEEAQQYSVDKALQIGGAALLGSLDAVLGAENVAMKAMRRATPSGKMTQEAIDAGIKALPEKALTKPGFGRAIGESVLGEAPLEGAQGAFGQYAQNVAMQQAGIDTPTGEGVFGSGLRDALVGALVGGTFSPLHKSTMNSAYNIDQFLRQAKGEQELVAEAEAALKRKQESEARVKEGLGVPSGDMLALPAPAAKAEREIEPALIDLQNPVGRITRNELPAETLAYIDQYRTENNLPRLTSFSLEDVKDAMTSQNPEGERAALDSIIAAKTGYTGKEKYSPEDIINAAVEKNIAPDTKGFSDFLQRATGERDVNVMSQPQLFSAFNALKATKASATGEQIVLPEGSNATRFTTNQYNEGLTLLGKYLEQGQGKPLSMQQATEVVSAQTDLGDYAADILRVAANNDDVIVENGPVFETVDKASGEVTGTYGAKEDAEQAAGKTATVRETRGPVVRSRIEEKQVKRAKLPGGHELEEETLKEGEAPAEYQIMVQGKAKPLATVLEESGVADKIERLQGLRKKEAEKIVADAKKHEATLNKGRAALESLEARGMVDTEGYKKAQAQQARAEDILGRRMEQMKKRIEELSAPLTSKPAGKKQVTRATFKLTKEGKEVGRFPSRAAAEESALSELTDAELETLTTQEGPTANRAAKALEARKEQKAGKTGIKIKGTTAGLEAAGVYTQETQAKIDALSKQLVPMLAKFGLGDVGLKIVRELQAGAEGSYLDKLIQVTLTADQPIITMRHEALHALKDLGFFTPAQWKTLEKKANDEWIGKYLKGVNAEFDGKVMTRYEAYKAMGLSDEDIMEEAIADAFGAFELGTDKPTPGMMAALFKRLQNFFAAFAQALGRAKIESAEEIFGKIERGELAKAGLEQTAKEKLSLAGAGVPRSTRSIMESSSKFAQAELGLNTEKAKGKTGANNVRDVAQSLNRHTLEQFGGVARDEPTAKDVADLAEAVADEVGYQLRVNAKTGTGLGWYSNNYPNALKKLGKVFPELETNPLARSVFSAIVAVTSNGEDVSSNIKSAIRYYKDFRNGKPLVAAGSRRAGALENNLSDIEKLFQKHGDNFAQELTKEITVADLNAYLRSVGEEPSSDYLKETKVPAAAIYFGPKLGAFFANLSGSEGYLTMDLWWTRSINRMRGLLIPKATDSSIIAFRDLMDRPSATREEVIAAAVPFKQKYEEYGYVTGLEFVAGSKEPRTNVGRPSWLAKAKRKAGPAFQQLMLEHKLEKMANTIYKNEYDMLAEAPFNASDRKFMYDVARSAQKLLKSEGIDLSLADIQAALWYYEKRLYAKLTGREADDIGYEEAIIAQASDNARREGPSVVFAQQPDRRNVAKREIGLPDQLGGLPEGKLSLKKGIVAEVAPNPDHVSATKWREMTPQERLDSTKAVANKILSRVFSELDLKGYTYSFSTGTYEGEANPNVIVEAPSDATEQELAELGRVLGYVLDQKAMVVFDESNKTSGDQAGFVKVVIPDGMSQEELSGLRSHIAREVPQADGDTLRNGALLYGNFSAYNDKVETISDEQYHQAILDAIDSFSYSGTIRVSEPETFHSSFIWPDTRADYLKETRYGESGAVQGEAGADVRGQGSRRLQTISEDAIALRDRWIDARGAARLGGRERGNAVDYGKPSAEYGIPKKDSVTAVGVHFSQQPRETLYSEFHGTGIRGLEKERLSEKKNADIRDRIYFYVDNGGGVRPEEGVGGSPHVIKLNNLYDTKADPLQFIKTSKGANPAERADQWERAIKEAGFDGYIVRNQAASQDYAILVGKHAVKTKLSLGKVSFATADEAENAAYGKAPPQTREFKLFFGASTLKDEGRPQVMYHGSDTDITTFYEDKPIFVTPDVGFAEDFAADRATDNGKDASAIRIYPLWVRAETPFDYENSEHVEQVMQRLIADQGATKFDSKLRLQSSTGTVDKVRQEMKSGLWSVIEDKRVQDVIKQLGFDSFNVYEGGNKNLAVYSAAQVKSVTGNIGEFGREAKDIRFSLPKVRKAVLDRVNATTTTREVKGFGERITEAITPKSRSYFRAKALNRYNQLGVYDRKLAEKMGGTAFLADRSAESAALMSDLGAGVTASALGFGDRHGGIPVYKNGFTTIDRSVKGLVASLAPLAKYGDPKVYQLYQYWAAVKRGTRLLEAGRERLINEGDIAYAAELEKQFPEFVQVQKDYTAFNNGVVKYMVDTGVLSKERGAEYMKYADYVPFYRQADGETTIGPNIFQSIAGVKPPKKLKGSEAPLADFLETIVRNTQASIQSGMKNAAAQRAVNVAMQVKEVDMSIERLNTKQSGPDIVNVLENGEQVSYRTTDSLLVDAIGSLHMPDIPFLSILSAPSDVLRNLVTKDPGFMMANLMRDSLSAWVTSGQKMTPIAGTVINFGKALAGKSPGMEAMMDSGIIGGYEFSANVESSGAKLATDLARKSGKEGLAAPLRAVRWLWEGLEKGTTASDAATRALVYERVMAETGNEAEALYRALEVMNFNRKGSSPVIRVLTAAVPFFNARLQGLDLFYRASTGQMNMDNAKGIQKAFFTNGAMMMGLSALYWFLTHDDEEYKKQEQETRDNNWLVPSAGIKMPTPFEVGVLFKTIPERILGYTFGTDTGKDFAKSMGSAMLGTFAFNPIPQTVKPIVEVATNFNFFTMRPIIGQGMEDVASKYQVGPSTSKAFEAFGSMTGISPMKVEHLYKGYTGTMGMYLVDVVDSILNANSNSPNATKRFEQLPVIKRFALDPEARGNITQYYELKNSVDTTVRTMNLLETTARPEDFSNYVQKNIGYLANKDYVRDLEKTMKELREMRTAVRSSSLTGDEKRDSLKLIGQMENNLTSNIQTVKKTIASLQ